MDYNVKIVGDLNQTRNGPVRPCHQTQEGLIKTNSPLIWGSKLTVWDPPETDTNQFQTS